ncbi:hypothetical protein HGRIS_011664 [Hohenbuehelia grisea]|uniref:Cytochrome P450 n=1 Tax=Hohenbuehelia grisea TaxID=104357 RepID=A0ABR3JVV3_9AGAR
MPELSTSTVVLALFGVFVISRVVKLVNGLKAVSYLPGRRVPFQPLALPGAALPTTWWNPGLKFPWLDRFTFYKRFGSENVSVVPFMFGVPGIYTSNLDVARQVITGGHKSSFIKPESASQALLVWGMNLVAADNEMWRKHRRVMGPAFNNKLYEFVCTETNKIYCDMVEIEGWAGKTVMEVPVIQKLTFKVALLVIGSCAFGFPFTWSEPGIAPDGSMPVQEAIRIVTETHMFKIAAPKWAWKLPIKWIQESKRAHEQLAAFMRAQVNNRKAEINDGGSLASNAFSMLVQANELESGKLRLSDEELIGNVFIMLFAGHETTAHTLAATLGFLSLHPEFQDEIYEEIVSVIGDKGEPTLENYPMFKKVLAAFYEALRMFPAGHILIREAQEDTVLTIPNPVGEEGSKTIPIPKGLHVNVDMIGVQYNPRYFDEPEKFKPERWYGVAPESEGFTAFSVGPRMCIGRKFATVESVTWLAMLLREWRTEPLLREGETVEAWRARVLDATMVLTLGVSDVPVRFVRRGA